MSRGEGNLTMQRKHKKDACIEYCIGIMGSVKL